MRDQWRRPHQSSPPKLVLEPARPTTGKLRIFFGVAPGVGKTYEMLLQAHAKRQDGHDVVVGFVKMHGRKDTEALLSGLEIIPRRRINYTGRTAEERTLAASSPAGRKSYLWTNWPNPMRPAAGIPGATLISKNC